MREKTTNAYQENENKHVPTARCAFAAMVSTASLKPHPRNPNKHNGDQIDLLAKNIAAFGWRRPIVVSKRSGFIVSGHGQLEAARKLRLATIPVDYQDFATEEEELAVLVADNRLSELSELQIPYVVSILRELDEIGLDGELTGYDETIIKELLDVVVDVPLPSEEEEKALIQDLLRGTREVWVPGATNPAEAEETKKKHKCPNCGFKW